MSSLLEALAWALIHFLWQGTLMGLGAWLALYLLRRARPQARYAVACAALGLCLALPLISVVRHWTPGVESSKPHSKQAIPGILETSVSPTQPIRILAPSEAPSLASSLARHVEAALNPHLPLIVFVWAMGSLLLAVRLAWGLKEIQRFKHRWAVEADEVWQVRLRELASRMGLQRIIQLRLSDHLASPMTMGWWRPLILVPAALLADMPPELMEALLAHELAHIRRHDYLVNLLQNVIEVLLFYHPAVWLISRRIRIEREQIADELAAKVLGEPRRLALALQELDLLQLHSLNLAQAAHGGHLMARIRQLLQPNPRPLAWKTIVSLVGITSICAGSAALTARAMGSKAAAQTATVVPLPPPPPPAPEPPVPAEIPAPPVPPPPPITKLSGPSCALIRRGDKTIQFTGNTSDLPQIYELQKKAKSDLFWFRQGEKTYTVEDPAFVARIQKLRAPLEDLERKQAEQFRKQAELSKQMSVHSQRMGVLGAQMGVEAANLAGLNGLLDELNKKLLPLTTQMGTYGAQIGALSAQMANANLSEAERDALEKQIDDIETKMDLLEEDIDKIGDRMDAKGQEMEKKSKPTEALAKQMEEAAKPMKALGKQMEDLGKQMEQLGKEQERLSPGILKAIQDLIPEALQKGKAKPVEGRN